ncbi:MAG: dehydratase [Sneathiella sp.]|jgi:acyl dehydratase|uniref:MaoC family dehydratase n=1 Tax=Sneathiella sp. TaxID=1964365 RepID=UPI000C462E57|nr:MaoC family dehydratase [Sneathiella sp.]MAL78800.1 dehydratase [Sneathiella sp.]|tara:strand:- start:45 stop:497 length:453 start_codon:yes stop_codon:yes gene_type:complete
MAGLWFEEFEEGMVFDHAMKRTVTETDNMSFCNATLNPQPLHIDFHAASKTEFGQPIVNSVFTLGLMIGMGVSETTLGTTVGNLGMTDVAFPHPVFHGDTISARTTVRAKRESKSRPSNGIVVFFHEAFNHKGDRVASCERTALMHKKPK